MWCGNHAIDISKQLLYCWVDCDLKGGEGGRPSYLETEFSSFRPLVCHRYQALTLLKNCICNFNIYGKVWGHSLQTNIYIYPCNVASRFQWCGVRFIHSVTFFNVLFSYNYSASSLKSK